ncbi:MAG: hypothetical protein QOF52_3163, partial [Propionibacteriaceae bacterium]|nr:hypothetical protein [Propionibacteriaceae bacterium]
MVQLSRTGWRVAAITTSLVASLATIPAAPAAAHKDDRPRSPQVVAT